LILRKFPCEGDFAIIPDRYAYKASVRHFIRDTAWRPVVPCEAGAEARLRLHHERTGASERAGRCRHLQPSCGGPGWYGSRDFGSRIDAEGSRCTSVVKVWADREIAVMAHSTKTAHACFRCFSLPTNALKICFIDAAPFSRRALASRLRRLRYCNPGRLDGKRHPRIGPLRRRAANDGVVT